MLEINCDLGEGIANEELIIPFIDAASVACGGHVGDQQSIEQTLIKIKAQGKKAGAHPSYPDPRNFGRKSLTLDSKDLIQSIQSQIELYLSVSERLELPMDHIKFHGALYNDAAKNTELAGKLSDFIATAYPGICLFVPPHSEIEKSALERQVPVRKEIFGDRAYRDDYQLLSRAAENSLLTDFTSVEKHIQPFIEQGFLISSSGRQLSLSASTVCFHGDNPGILAFLPKIRQKWWT